MADKTGMFRKIKSAAKSLTEKAMEIKIVLQKTKFLLMKEELSEADQKKYNELSLYIEWKRGNFKQYSKAIPFDLSKSGKQIGSSEVSIFEYPLFDEFGTVSGFRWNKKGEIQPKKCEFKIFLQKE